MHIGPALLSMGVILSLTATKCSRKVGVDSILDDNPIEIALPEGGAVKSGPVWDAQQRECVRKENIFALQCLRNLYSGGGGASLVFSPLSLQYALAMLLNGAEKETYSEIAEALGYGADSQCLNDFMSTLMEQLPAVDTTVEIKAANALMVNQKLRVRDEFANLLNTKYYAPVEYLDVARKSAVVNRINNWVSKNTNGFIPQLVTENEITDDFSAALLNSLYFKAPWSDDGGGPLFRPGATLESQPFYPEGRGQVSVDYLRTGTFLRYARREAYQAVEIPYASWDYAMYVLLPDKNRISSMAEFLDFLTFEEWSTLRESLTTGPKVHLQMPKFEYEKSFKLNGLLKGMGIDSAFIPGRADFGKMIDSEDGRNYSVSGVLQKAKISVTEWGTEAAAVTSIIMVGSVLLPDYEEVFFTADHPYVYIIAERESGLILFEGVFTGKE